MQEQLSDLGPVFEIEPLDEYVYSPVHDRYFTPEQLEHAASLEVDERESEHLRHCVQIERGDTAPIALPKYSLAAARGDDNVSFDPVTTPADTLQRPVHELVQFQGGLVVLADVNPLSGLEQVRKTSCSGFLCMYTNCLVPMTPCMGILCSDTCNRMPAVFSRGSNVKQAMPAAI